MNWIELYFMFGVIGSIIGIIALIVLVIYIIITGKKTVLNKGDNK